MSAGSARGASPDAEIRTRRPLFSGLGVSVADVRCRAHVEPHGAEEPNETHSIVFVRRGVFVRTDRERTLVADANQILFFNRGEPYRFAHPIPGGDDCTILALDEACARAATARLARSSTGSSGPFPAGHALSTPRAARLQLELLRLVSPDANAPALDTQDAVAELVDESIAALRRTLAAARRRPGAGRARRRDIVESAKLALSRSLASPPSLVDLAAALDCSPFHLSRTFRAETGLGLRHYVRRLRARLAAERLRRGARDLTSIALELGFYDHSHFTNAFRREWGAPPSRLARELGEVAIW